MNIELTKQEISTGLNFQTAEWLNNKHKNIATGTKQLIFMAVEIGKVLSDCQKNKGFVDWLEKNVSFSQTTAYKYISLFTYKNQITKAGNLNEAYKMIESFETQKKKSETAKANERVDKFLKTGKKPEGWRQHTDDKLAKEEAERKARIAAINEEAIKKSKESEKQKTDRDAEIKRNKEKSEELSQYFEEYSKELQKRIDFKEKIRISAQGENDPFMDALIDFLNGLEDDNRRVEACYNIIKICKRIANELQTNKEN